MKKITLLIVNGILLFSLITLVACKKDEQNRSPNILSISASPLPIEANSQVTISVEASDPDGDQLTYQYIVSGGSIEGSGKIVSWQTPSQTGPHAVTVTVNDGHGGQNSSTMNVDITSSKGMINGTAEFIAGFTGDLSGALIGLFASEDDLEDNEPIDTYAATGSGNSVTYTITGINPGTYYLGIIKDNDSNFEYSVGDFIGWYGSGTIDDPDFYAIQLSEGDNITANMTVFVIEEEPTSISGTATLAGSLTGDLANSKAYLYNSIDDWVNYSPSHTITVVGSGNSVDFEFSGLEPGSYYLDVFKDNDGNNIWSDGDFVGWYGDLESLYAIDLYEEDQLFFTITMYLVEGKSAQEQRITISQN